jgi:hypothetical protein
MGPRYAGGTHATAEALQPNPGLTRPGSTGTVVQYLCLAVTKAQKIAPHLQVGGPRPRDAALDDQALCTLSDLLMTE